MSTERVWEKETQGFIVYLRSVSGGTDTADVFGPSWLLHTRYFLQLS